MTTETYLIESSKLEARLRLERCAMKSGYPALDPNTRWIVEHISDFDAEFIGGTIAKLQEEWK